MPAPVSSARHSKQAGKSLLPVILLLAFRDARSRASPNPTNPARWLVQDAGWH